MAKRAKAAVEDAAPAAPTAAVEPWPVGVLITQATAVHKIARCRWCGGPFVKVYRAQWICQTLACAERQVAHAVLPAEPIPDALSPYLFLPLPLQVEIEDNPTRYLLVHGAAGISKSYGARWHLYARCRKIAGYQALLLRCTYDQLEKNHLRYMDAEARALGDAKWTGGNVRKFTFTNGSEIRFGFCQDESDIAGHTGIEWDELLCDEAVTFLPKAIREIQSRTRGNALSRAARELLGGIKGRSRLLTNPGGRAALFLDDFYIKREVDLVEFPQYRAEHYGAISGDIRDNPYLDDDFEETSLGVLDADRFAQLARGRWDVFEGQFFRVFDPAIHVVNE